ncbi:hypothetical protein J2X63_001778 [Agromyces sp. 3263]|uniref:SMI1/KNR4 family protein n=1 Tax=Agromyces sp. 3263 TaxID=2817750 RepID=UPI0028554630|nr:SMI1/KNR4 family protein [Agromyces sp. 3263]MDR6906092.1 hypothetical protein [Agromyces sp. 3263]
MNNKGPDRPGGAWWAVVLDRPEVSTRPPASRAELNAAEAKVDTALPLALRDLYLQTDGVWDRAGQWYVIWPLEHLLARNGGTAAERTGVAFGDDGTGNAFCIHTDGSVSYWSEIDAKHTCLAPDLESFWTAWVHDDLPPH